MTYRIEFTRATEREISKLSEPIRGRVLDSISGLANNPRPTRAKKLTGRKNAWRIRIGDFRVIYEVVDSVLTVTVIRVANRREVYR
jgi:mRNA interferase RelE/StbE